MYQGILLLTMISYNFWIAGYKKTLFENCAGKTFNKYVHIIKHKKILRMFTYVNFIYPEKATKFCEISTILRFDWHYIGQIYGGDFASTWSFLIFYWQDKQPGTISSMQSTNRRRSIQFQPPFYLESSQRKLMQI